MGRNFRGTSLISTKITGLLGEYPVQYEPSLSPVALVQFKDDIFIYTSYDAGRLYLISVDDDGSINILSSLSAIGPNKINCIVTDNTGMIFVTTNDSRLYKFTINITTFAMASAGYVTLPFTGGHLTFSFDKTLVFVIKNGTDIGMCSVNASVFTTVTSYTGTIPTTDKNNISFIYPISQTVFLISYSTSALSQVVVATISGSTISYGTTVSLQISSTAGHALKIVNLGNSKFAFIGSNSVSGPTPIISISGISITYINYINLLPTVSTFSSLFFNHGVSLISANNTITDEFGNITIFGVGSSAPSENTYPVVFKCIFNNTDNTFSITKKIISNDTYEDYAKYHIGSSFGGHCNLKNGLFIVSDSVAWSRQSSSTGYMRFIQTIKL